MEMMAEDQKIGSKHIRALWFIGDEELRLCFFLFFVKEVVPSQGSQGTVLIPRSTRVIA